MMTEEEYTCKRKQINLWWTIGVLCFVTIALIAWCFLFQTKKIEYENLMKILGLISTLLAITLSVFSILFSHQSSVKAEEALSRLESEVENFETTYSHLSKYILEHSKDDNKNDNSAINSVGNNN